MIELLFFKSKKNKEEKDVQKKSAAEASKAGSAGEETFEKETTDYENPSLMDIAAIIQKNGYTVYSHDQGRKVLEKKLKDNIK